MTKLKFYLILIASFPCCFYYIYWNSTNIEVLKILCLINLAFSLIPLFLHRRSPYLGPIFLVLSYVIYSIFIGRYFSPELAPAINAVIDYEFDFLGLFITFLFIFFFTFFLKSHQKIVLTIEPVSKSSKNIIISLGCIFVALCLQFIFMERVDGARGNYSPIYEYSIVFCIPALFYSLRNKYFKFFIISILIFMILRDFSLGHRATGVQITLLIYALYLYKFYSLKRFSFSFFLAIFLFNFIASFRNDFIFSFDNLTESMVYLFNDQFLSSSTAFFAWVASLTFLSVQTLVPYSEILTNFLDFIISMIIPGTYGNSLYMISKEYYQHQNGGLLPLYMFYYLNYAAIPFIAIVLAFYFNLIKTKKTTTFKSLLFIYIFVTSPRWLIYSPTGLFRGAAIFSIIILLIFMFKYALNMFYVKRSQNV